MMIDFGNSRSQYLVADLSAFACSTGVLALLIVLAMLDAPGVFEDVNASTVAL